MSRKLLIFSLAVQIQCYRRRYYITWYESKGSPQKTKFICSVILLQNVPTGKMIFLIGFGGDGKGMEGLLYKTVLCSTNFASINCGKLTERAELRRSSHFGWNKKMIKNSRIYETKTNIIRLVEKIC